MEPVMKTTQQRQAQLDPDRFVEGCPTAIIARLSAVGGLDKMSKDDAAVGQSNEDDSEAGSVPAMEISSTASVADSP